MAHFAKLDENNIVLAVHVVNNEVLITDNVESEQAGIDFLTGLHGHTNWKQTSYNGTFRKQYAGIGYTYSAVDDVFIAPQPYPSWSLDDDFEWQPPIPKPEGDWVWNEAEGEWESVA
jgi:hypothetical protein